MPAFAGMTKNMNYLVALNNLAANKLRTLLAMIGILVGTASVVAMVSSGELATQAALAQFKALGTDMLSVVLYSQTSENSSFDIQKALQLQNATPEIISMAAYVITTAPISYRGNNLNASIIGATQSLQSTANITMKYGRFISDLDHYSQFCVIGNGIYQQLQVQNPVGTLIHIGNNVCTIIGVANDWPENSFLNQDLNQTIIMPIKATELINKYSDINNIIFRLQPNADITAVEAALTKAMTILAPDRELFFRSAKQLVKSMVAQHEIFTILLGLIGSISLLVGGIGVMNIMLVAVLERRREIGVRLALGAKRKDIQQMFLLEAIILSIIGGGLGIIVGILISFIIAEFAHWNFNVFIWPIFAGFSVSAMVGIFFGFYPARQASLLNPMDTLRAE